MSDPERQNLSPGRVPALSLLAVTVLYLAVTLPFLGCPPLFDPDEPLSSERLQQSGKRIMGRFYQFGYVFLVPVSIISFGSLVLFLYNIRLGWRWWYRSWRNYIVRFGGWVILRKWARTFRTDKFPEKLQNARKHIN